MDIKELLLKLVGKAYNKSADEISSLVFKKEADNTEVVKDDALDQLLELNKAHVSRLDTENKALYDKGYKKAEAVVRAQSEKDVKEKFSITEDKQWPELLEAVAEKIAKDPGTGELEEDKVKRSKTYLDTVEQLKKEKAADIKQWEEKFNSREKQLQKEATLKIIDTDALTYLDTILKPILPSDPKIALEWRNNFLRKIKEGFDFEVKEDGKKIPLKKEGDDYKVHVDEHRHPVSFEDFLKQQAGTMFEFQKGDARSGTGNNNDDVNANGNKGYKGPKPNNEAEYSKAIAEAKDDDEKIAITKLYTGK